MVELASIIEEIQRSYSESYPNGLLEGWDTKRFSQILELIFSDCKFSNQTDFNYSNCNSYDVELGESEDDGYLVLTIKISYICDAFSLHVIRYINRKCGGVIPLHNCNEYLDKMVATRNVFLGKGFREIKPDEMDIEVEGVELELAEVATVGKCLFDDFE